MWHLGARDKNSMVWDKWSYQDGVNDFEEILRYALKWKGEGQHVRIEWIPIGASKPAE